MSKKQSWISINILAILITVFFAGTTFAAEAKKTIEGVVTESYQIVTDKNEAYDIGESEAGDKLMENAGKKVRATGKVEYDEDTDTRTITVDSFTVIGEPEMKPETGTEPENEMESQDEE